MLCQVLHARGVKTLPGMHCELRSRVADVSVTTGRLLLSFIDTESPTDNGQQVAIDCNIDL